MPVKKVWPWYYAGIENGKWRRWLGGPISMVELQRSTGNKASIIIANTLVHSFIFEQPANHPARWDCRNGWTTRIGDARLQYPTGKHGEKPPHEINYDLFEEIVKEILLEPEAKKMTCRLWWSRVHGVEVILRVWHNYMPEVPAREFMPSSFIGWQGAAFEIEIDSQIVESDWQTP